MAKSIEWERAIESAEALVKELEAKGDKASVRQWKRTIKKLKVRRDNALKDEYPNNLPIHRTEANYGIVCSTCDDSGCLDCTDPA